MTIEIRPVARDERRAVVDVVRTTLLSAPISDEAFEKSEPSWDVSDSVAAWDGDRPVATGGTFRLDTTVPGGARLATAGVTRVGVLPTHTRRGLLRSMLTKLLDDARRERGQVLASLRASEPGIYGRFGFGLAGDYCAAEIDPTRARPLSGPTTPGSIELLRPESVIETVKATYDRVGRSVVGTVSRPDFMWARYFDDAVNGGDSAEFVAVHRSLDASGVPDEVDGYAHYTVKWIDDDGVDVYGVGEIHEVVASDPAVIHGLWRYLLDVDLIRRWRATERPVDDLIRRSFADYRAYRLREHIDEQWVRILDVEAALSQRTYGPANDAVVIEVADPMFTENTGCWRVSAGGTERCNGRAPDISCSIAALSAAYMGGVSWRTLSATGDADVSGDHAALTLADALFATHSKPFSGTFF